MKFLTAFLIVFLWVGVAYATPQRESETIDAQPLVAYGKDTNGVLRALLVDTDGTLQTA